MLQVTVLKGELIALVRVCARSVGGFQGCSCIWLHSSSPPFCYQSSCPYHQEPPPYFTTGMLWAKRCELPCLCQTKFAILPKGFNFHLGPKNSPPMLPESFVWSYLLCNSGFHLTTLPQRPDLLSAGEMVGLSNKYFHLCTGLLELF